jgi:hypothetical protein
MEMEKDVVQDLKKAVPLRVFIIVAENGLPDLGS